MLIFAWEQWVPCVKFSKYTPETPHIYCSSVGYAHNYLGCSVEPRLDVCVDALIVHTAASIVNNFNSRLVCLFQQDVFWLQITVNDFMIALEFKGLQELDCEPANQTKTDTLKVVVPDELI